MVCCVFLLLVQFVLKLDFIRTVYVSYISCVCKSKTNE
jgi:hypothetical protein